jgi:hypothetical protein
MAQDSEIEFYALVHSQLNVTEAVLIINAYWFLCHFSERNNRSKMSSFVKAVNKNCLVTQVTLLFWRPISLSGHKDSSAKVIFKSEFYL